MKKNFIILSFASVFALVLSSTAMAENKSKASDKAQKVTLGYSILKNMANSMGGMDNILSLRAVEFMASGTRLEPEQSNKPAGEFKNIGEYNYRLVKTFSKQQSRTEWINNVKYPFIEQRTFTEVINGEHGAVFGFDTIIAPAQAPMLSTRIGARVKQNLVSSPLALIHRAKKYSSEIKYLGIKEFNGRRHQVISIPGWDQPIRLFIDVASKLPSKAETLEDDSVYGDTQWEVLYNDWKDADGIKIPSSLTHKINGKVINNETRFSFNLNVNINNEYFAIPAELIVDFNSDQFSWGIRSSQWFNRFLSIAIPFDLDQRTAATSQIVEVAPNIFHAKSFTHHSMIIEMKDYLIVTEAPLYDERSVTVINAIKERWPTKPIKYIILTHFHNDHIGGIRGYAAIGATVIVGSQTKDHYEAIFKAPHTVFPDTYAMNKIDVKIKTVEAGDDLILTDGTRNVRIFDVANRHAIGTLVPFVEDANLVFVSDLYSPEFFTPTIPQLFLSWSIDLLTALQASDLDIKWMVGGHGGVSSYDTFVSQVESSQ